MYNTAELMKILQICDSLFPVGAFTLSNGLETYVQKGIIDSPEDLEEYLDSYITLLPFNELGAAALAYCSDERTLIRLDEIYTAAKAPFEIRSGSQKVTRRFFKICDSPEHSGAALYKKLIAEGKCFGHQCIAYGLFMKDNSVSLTDGLSVYGYSICSAIVTNCVKLVPLSQIAGQKILSESFDRISRSVKLASEVCAEDIGIVGAGFDLRAMQHEKLYSRQYMS